MIFVSSAQKLVNDYYTGIKAVKEEKQGNNEVYEDLKPDENTERMLLNLPKSFLARNMVTRQI
jgi:hypothetical protein